MSYVASLDLSRELYELSGWEEAGQSYKDSGEVVQGFTFTGKHPAYDLGHLLRQLPDYAKVLKKNERDEHRWIAGAISQNINAANYVNGHIWYEADTPEDAACKLAIELIRQGVIKP